MKILQIFPRFPWPLKDGGSVAFYNSLNGFRQKGCELTVAVLNTSKHRINFEELPEQVKNLAEFHLIDIDNTITPLGAFKNLFEQQSYIISRFYNKDFEQLLVNLVQKKKFDAIIFEGLQITAYINVIRHLTTAKCIYRAHNIEQNIWLSQALIEKNSLRKIYLTIQARRLSKFEINCVKKFDAILPITFADQENFKKFGVKTPMHVMPVGIELNKFEKYKPANQGAVFHIGSMDWMPNQEAVLWFLREVWPEVYKRTPLARFMVAGRNMPAAFFSINQPGVTIAGEVDNGYEFMQQQGVMVVPLFAGSGMRVKVIEGMAMGKCIVATSMGMEGVPAKAGIHYLPADNASAFADTLTDLLEHPEKGEQIGIEARKFVFEHYNNSKIIEQVLTFIKQLKLPSKS